MYYEGTGQALIYPFWVADPTTDTLIEIVNRATGLVPQTSSPTTNRKGRWILVHFTFHEEKNSEDVRDFNICLSPGDAWTAAITLEGAVTHLKSDDLSSGGPLAHHSALGPPPVDEVLGPASYGNPVRGYISAVMIDNGTSEHAGCDSSHESDNEETGNPDNALFDSERHQALNAPLLGRAIYVNIGNGLATGFNSEAIKGYCSNNPTTFCLGNVSVGPLGGGSATGSVRAFRTLALGQHRRNARGTLLGRWLRDGANNLDTQLVLTFPTGKFHQFNFCSEDLSNTLSAFGTTSCGAGNITTIPFDFRITATTQMTLWIRNDEECVSISNRKINTPNEVNVITFTSLPTSLFNTTDSTRDGSCKREDRPATSGWFRLLFDQNEDEITDSVTGTFGPGVGGAPVGTLKVPKVIAAVGFVTMTAQTTGPRISATFPFQSEEPFDFFDCYNDLTLNCETHDSSGEDL
jgi:hypothetical protein